MPAITPPSEISIRRLREILMRRNQLAVDRDDFTRENIETYMGRPLREFTQREVDTLIEEHTGERQPDLNPEIWSRAASRNLAERASRHFSEMFQAVPTPEGGYQVETRTTASTYQTITTEDIERLRDMFDQEQAVSRINGHTRNLLYGLTMQDMYRDEPRGPFPRVTIEEKPLDRHMTIPKEIEELVTKDIQATETIKVYAAALRSVKVDTPRTRNLFELGVHRLCSVFDLRATITHDSDIYTATEVFSQQVPRCEIFAAGKFGIDIEKHPHCDKCRCWEDCCEMKGVYERQEEECKEMGYRYIVSIVQQNLMTS